MADNEVADGELTITSTKRWCKHYTGGEIDIMEWVEGSTATELDAIQGTYRALYNGTQGTTELVHHWGSNCHSLLYNGTQGTYCAADFSQGYHVYGVGGDRDHLHRRWYPTPTEDMPS